MEINKAILFSQEAAPRDALRKKYGSPGKKTGIAPACEKIS
jgi:hypothetical protein